MIELNHTIVPAHDKVASAKFLAKILGLEYKGAWGHFAPVKINESLTLDFDNRKTFESHHYAFKVSENDFKSIFERIKAEGVAYGSGPGSQEDMKINTWNQGRGVYFKDPNGHVMELLTQNYSTTAPG